MLRLVVLIWAVSTGLVAGLGLGLLFVGGVVLAGELLQAEIEDLLGWGLVAATLVAALTSTLLGFWGLLLESQVRRLWAAALAWIVAAVAGLLAHSESYGLAVWPPVPFVLGVAWFGSWAVLATLLWLVGRSAAKRNDRQNASVASQPDDLLWFLDNAADEPPGSADRL